MVILHKALYSHVFMQVLRQVKYTCEHICSPMFANRQRYEACLHNMRKVSAETTTLLISKLSFLSKTSDVPGDKLLLACNAVHEMQFQLSGRRGEVRCCLLPLATNNICWTCEQFKTSLETCYRFQFNFRVLPS